jgi:hypothetical protein
MTSTLQTTSLWLPLNQHQLEEVGREAVEVVDSIVLRGSSITATSTFWHYKKRTLLIFLISPGVHVQAMIEHIM